MQMAARRRRMGGFSPLTLFAAGEPGVWLDPSDLSTLFQDDAGTTPVTAAGQSVGRILDKSGRGNHATQATAAARPIYQVDSSGRGYLSFDGVDDWIVTPTITPGTDKAQTFAGVRKLSDTAGIVTELSVNVNNNAGTFYLVAGDDASAQYSSLGRGDASAASGQNAKWTTAPAPDTAVLTATHDIASDLSTIRRNGAVGTSATANKGAGNFLAYPLYIGRRGGATLPFNGNLYGLITRFGPNLTADQISQAERWMNARTGAF
ncbi:MAG: hypothetical protein ACLGIP_18105 [Alphaproteobacteria bacterium]